MPSPLNGTWIAALPASFTPASSRIITPIKWGSVPTPGDAKLSLPGEAFTALTTSARVLYGLSFDVTHTKGFFSMSPRKVKSSYLYGTFLTAGATAWVATRASRIV